MADIYRHYFNLNLFCMKSIEWKSEYVSLELLVKYKKTSEKDMATYEFHGQHLIDEGQEEIEIVSVELETKKGTVDITSNTLKKVLEELL